MPPGHNLKHLPPGSGGFVDLRAFIILFLYYFERLPRSFHQMGFEEERAWMAIYPPISFDS